MNHYKVNMDMKKISNRKRIEQLKLDDEPLELPIASLDSVRNAVSSMNAKYYLEGKRWASTSERERGVVLVYRES